VYPTNEGQFNTVL